MDQLLAHLVGDYVLQSHAMAIRKTTSMRWALIHAAFYTLPFLVLTRSPAALFVILATHAGIDRYAIARRWCVFYGVGFPGLWWRPKVCECGHPLASHLHSIMTWRTCDPGRVGRRASRRTGVYGAGHRLDAEQSHL